MIFTFQAVELNCPIIILTESLTEIEDANLFLLHKNRLHLVTLFAHEQKHIKKEVSIKLLIHSTLLNKKTKQVTWDKNFCNRSFFLPSPKPIQVNQHTSDNIAFRHPYTRKNYTLLTLLKRLIIR